MQWIEVVTISSHPIRMYTTAMEWDGMGTIVIGANALLAGEAPLVGDTPGSASGAFRSGRRGINSMATTSGGRKTGLKRPPAHARSLRDNYSYRASLTPQNHSETPPPETRP